MTASITLYNLGDYNEGRLNPFTIDLTDCITSYYYLKRVAQGMWDTATSGNVLSSRCTACGHIHIANVMTKCKICGSTESETKITGEEWIIADYEGIPAKYIGTYNLDGEYFYYKKMLEDSEMDSDAFDAGVACSIDLDKIADAYQGNYSSDEDFAIECAAVMGFFDEVAVWPETCIDWKQTAYELMFDYVAENGHYFSMYV